MIILTNLGAAVNAVYMCIINARPLNVFIGLAEPVTFEKKCINEICRCVVSRQIKCLPVFIDAIQKVSIQSCDLPVHKLEAKVLQNNFKS